MAEPRLLKQTVGATVWWTDRELRFSMRTLTSGTQVRVDDLHGLALDAEIPAIVTPAGLYDFNQQVADLFVSTYPPPNRREDHAKAKAAMKATGSTTAPLRGKQGKRHATA